MRLEVSVALQQLHRHPWPTDLYQNTKSFGFIVFMVSVSPTFKFLQYVSVNRRGVSELSLWDNKVVICRTGLHLLCLHVVISLFGILSYFSCDLPFLNSSLIYLSCYRTLYSQFCLLRAPLNIFKYFLLTFFFNVLLNVPRKHFSGFYFQNRMHFVVICKMEGGAS